MVAMNGDKAEWIAVHVQASRAVCEWSEGHAKDKLKYEIDLRDMCG